MKSPFARLMVAASLLLLATAAFADAYPDRPITMIVPFPAGNSSDVAMRLLAQEMQPALGQPVVVDNKAGAGGTIGAAYVARRPGDGYTLIMGSPGPMAINPALRKNLSYDPLKSFEPVAPVAALPLVVVVSADSGIKDLQQLLKVAKEKPGTINYASSGIGSTQHLVMASLAACAGVAMTHVPFQGAGAGMTAIVGGQVQVMADVLSAVLPMVKSGRLVPIAVTAARRVDTLPNVPTVAEQGLKDFAVQSWVMIYAPTGTPQNVVRRLNVEIVKALQSPKLKKTFEEQSMLPLPLTFDGMRNFMGSEVATWRRLVEVSGATAE
jgi:tripartite-type tricarboxylate transporter receptor subunit TctC